MAAEQWIWYWPDGRTEMRSSYPPVSVRVAGMTWQAVNYEAVQSQIRMEAAAGGPSGEVRAPVDDYGLYGNGGDVPLGPGQLLPLEPGRGSSFVGVVAQAMVLTTGLLLARFGAVTARIMWTTLVGLFGKGGRVMWGNLPGWIRTLLIYIGITEAVDLVLDAVDWPSEEGILPPAISLPGPGEALQQLQGVAVLRVWVANGVVMARLSDGRMAAQKADGSWKLWRPKRPIVIFSGGAGNLRTFLRADRALNRQAQRLAKALRRRAPRRVRTVQGRARSVDGETTRIVNVD